MVLSSCRRFEGVSHALPTHLQESVQGLVPLLVGFEEPKYAVVRLGVYVH